MKGKLLVFVLAAAVAAFAQGHGGGHPVGPPSIQGQGAGMGQPPMTNGPHAQPEPPVTNGPTHEQPEPTNGAANAPSTPPAQRSLRQSQINGGAFRMLERRTGMTSQQLQQLYASSGARNFGQFVAAIVVSKNLNLDTNMLLADLKTESLGRALQSMGISSKTAKSEIKKANAEIKAANKNRSGASQS